MEEEVPQETSLNWIKERVNFEPNAWERFIFHYPRTACCTFLTCALLLSALNVVFPFQVQLDLVTTVRSDPIVKTYDAWKVRTTGAEGDVFIKVDDAASVKGLVSSFVQEVVLRVRQPLTLQGQFLEDTELLTVNGESVKTKTNVEAELAKVGVAGGRYLSNVSLSFQRISGLPRLREFAHTGFGFLYEGVGEAVTSPKHLKVIKDFESAVLAMPGYAKRCMLTYSLLDNSSKCSMPRSLLQHLSEAPKRHQALIDEGFVSKGVPKGFCGWFVPFGNQPCYSSAFLHPEGSLPGDGELASKLGDMCSPNTTAAAGAIQFMQDISAGVAQSKRQERGYLVGKNFNCATGQADLMRSVFFLGFPTQGFGPETNPQSCEDCSKDAKKWVGGELQDMLTALIKKVEEGTGNSLRIYVDWGPHWGVLFDGMIWADGLLGCASLVAVFFFLWVNTRSCFLAAFGMLEVVLSIPMALAIWSMFAGLRGDNYLTGLQFMVLFIIMGVGADDIFVLFDAYKQSFEMLVDDTTPLQRFAWAYRRATGAMLVTSMTTMLGMCAAGLARLPCIQVFGFFGVLVVFWDFVLVITYFAAVMIVYERHVMPYCCHPCALFRSCFDFLFHRCLKRAPRPEPDDKKSTGNQFEIGVVERFFVTKYEPLVLHRAKFLIPFWSVVILVMGIVMCAMLRPAKSAPDFFSKDHPIQKFLDLSSEGFERKRQPRIDAVFGMADDPIDRTGVGLSEPEKVGKPLYSGLLAAQISAPQVQQEILNFCSAARRSSLVDAWSPELCSEHVIDSTQVRVQRNCRTGVYCFMEPVRDYVVHQLGRTFPPGADLVEILKSRSWQLYFGNYKKALFDEGIRHYHSGCMFDGSKLLYCYLSVNATLPGISRSSSGYENLKDMYDRYQNLFESNLRSIPFQQTSGYWSWMVTQGSLVTSTITSLGGCLVFATFVLILFTSNLVVSLLCMFNIVCIVTIVAGIVSLMGWSLGIMEALGMIVIVGLAVDYSVHIMHAYNESNDSSRRARVRYATRTMGVSVVSGAITTFLASIFLWFAKITFFFNFGTFMALTVLFSVLLTLTFLMPLCYVCGPEHSFGDIPFLARFHKRRKSRVSQCVHPRSSLAAVDNTEEASPIPPAEAAPPSVALPVEAWQK